MLAPRWDTNGEDVYGEGPGSVALGDVKMLQKEQTMKLRGIEQETNPALMAPSSLKNSQVTSLPGGMTFYDDRQNQGQGIKRLYESRFSVLEVRGDIIETQQRIDTAFFVDLFRMISADQRGDRTATEIMQLQEEKMLMLGPVLNRLDAELLDPAVDRIFNIMNRQGKLPPPPREIQGLPLTVEYVSILARAQRMQEVTQVDRWLGTIGSMAQSDPTVIDNVDRDATASFYAESLGVPAKLQNSEEKKMAIRGARAQAQAQEAATAQALQVAQGAKLLSETNTTDQNALTAVLGQ